MSQELVAWLPEQRWFRAKGRAIAGVATVDRAPAGPAELSVLEVSYRDGGAPDRYLVPLADGHEPREGAGAWSALATTIVRGATLHGERGAFVGHATEAAEALAGDARNLGERRLGVEQSNTSVVVGERLILKLYRRLEPGENPDVEIGTFLTDAGFVDTPAVAGSLTYRSSDGQTAAAAMLQELVVGARDAWGAMLEALSADRARAVEMAASIGRVTARLHAALASRPDDSAFPWRTATVAETASWRASAEGQLSEAIGAVSGPVHARLVEIAPAIRAGFADAFGAATGETRIGRMHGDYHLGQLLVRPDGGFSVIDFEGEPARPLEERRRPSSPLRDVAGMLRSLDYAARTVEGDPSAAHSALRAIRDAFLAAYGERTASEAALLDAFELEKACYEVRYEARNRPDWVWLPMGALERLVAGA